MDLRRSEIARDIVRVVQDAPFEALRINGEPLNEKIRLVGATLLEIASRATNRQLKERVKADLTILLDILSRLDSKACEALIQSATTQCS
ncbi:hypothetical protein VTO58DRAFT_102876 [Aureobasidium pullulans]